MVIVGFGNYLDTIFMFEYITNLTIVAYLVFNFYSIRYEENSGNDFEYVGIEDNVIITKDTHYKLEPEGIGVACFKSMLRYKDKIAQVDGDTGHRDSYKTLYDQCISTALKMQHMRVKQHDVIAICSYHHLHSCLPLIASIFLGAIVTSFDPRLSHYFITQVLRQLEPKLIFVDAGVRRIIEEAIKNAGVKTEMVVFGYASDQMMFLDFIKPFYEDTFIPVAARDLKDTALIFYSHGSTNLPRGSCLSHYSILQQATSFIKLGITLDVNLCYTPFYWVCSVVLLVASILTGSLRVVYSQLNLETFWNTLTKFKVTSLFLLHPEIMQILKYDYSTFSDTRSLEVLAISGSSLPKDKLIEVKYVFPNTRIFQMYAMTEAGGPVTFFNLKDNYHLFILHNYPSTCGKPLPGFSYRVVDKTTGRNLGPFEKGELWIKSKTIMNGYFHLNSSDVLDSDGWLKTGDAVYYDEIYCFYVVGRVSNVFKFQDWFVCPDLIQKILMSNPVIKDAVVIPVPHGEDVNHPFALVVLEETTKRMTPAIIMRYVEERVHYSHRLRGGVKIVEAIPETKNGYRNYNELCSMVLAKKI